MSKGQDDKEKPRALRHGGVFYMQTNPKQTRKWKTMASSWK